MLLIYRSLAAWDPYDQNDYSRFFDPEWMFGMKDGFDVVIGNPPYGVKYTTATKKELSRNYPPSKKIPDSYSFFVVQGLSLLKEQGSLIYIIPNTFCDLENGDEFRQHLLANFSFELIWQSGWAFDSAVVDTIVLMLKHARPSFNHELIVLTDKGSHKFIQSQFLDASLNKIDFRSSPHLIRLRDYIQHSTIPLSSLFSVKAGVKMYEVGKGTPPQTKGVVSEKPFSTKGNAPLGWRTLYRGTDIAPYCLSDTEEHVQYGPWLAAPRTPDLFEPPKILMRRTDDRLRSCLDITNAVCVNSCHVIKKLGSNAANIKLYSFALAVLNSSTCQWIFEIDNPQMIGKTFAEIKVVYVERLRFPRVDDRHVNVLHHLTQIVLYLFQNPGDEHKRSFLSAIFFHQLIDDLVFELYFSDHMKEKQIDILQFVENDLAEVIRGRVFEQQPDTEKESVINQLHARWTHPDSEVRNRIKLFAVRSPDILKPILESR